MSCSFLNISLRTTVNSILFTCVRMFTILWNSGGTKKRKICIQPVSWVENFQGSLIFVLLKWSLTTNLEHRYSIIFILQRSPWSYFKIVKSINGSSKNCKVNIFTFCFYFSADSVKRKNFGHTSQTELWTGTTARVVTYSLYRLRHISFVLRLYLFPSRNPALYCKF